MTLSQTLGFSLIAFVVVYVVLVIAFPRYVKAQTPVRDETIGRDAFRGEARARLQVKQGGRS